MVEDVGSTHVTRFRGEQAVVLANAQMSVVVVPARGAKVVSLEDRVRGMEWLAPPIRDWTTPSAGDWLGQDCGGWDECFPNVVAEPHPLTGQPLAGHGEVWSRAWRLEDSNPQQVVTSILGIGLPFQLSRTLSLRDHRLSCDYRLENLAAEPLVANWLMHLLLGIVASTAIVLPDGAVAQPDPDTGPFTCARSSVPHDPHSDLDRLSIVQRIDEKLDLQFGQAPTGTGTKWITDRQTVSSCLVRRPNGGLRVEVNCEQIPNFGLWINDGGWPEPDPQRHLGIEAALGGYDRLSRAYAEGTAIQLGGHQTKRWSVNLLTLDGGASCRVNRP